MHAARHIENLIYTYADLIDKGNLEGVAELFRNGEVLSPTVGNSSRGYAEVLAIYQNAARIYEDTGTPKTKHLTTNVIIEVEGDSATSRSYFTVIQATESLPLQPIIAGRYEDKFTCTDGQWCFSERGIFVDHVGDVSAHLLQGTAGLVAES
jgi:hypothetical protein